MDGEIAAWLRKELAAVWDGDWKLGWDALLIKMKILTDPMWPT